MMNSNDDAKKWNAALYIRLSKDDGDKEESDSVSNQRIILQEFVQKHDDLILYREYVDDGYSGLNANRPAFQQMLDDIDDGMVDCVIVKDLSRFGRNYRFCDLYQEELFPNWGVRFIAIGDGYDSIDCEDEYDNMLSMKNYFNEFSSRDTSKKVRRVIRELQAQGKFVAAFAPYGYKRNPVDKHRLLVDDYAAGIVRKIYEMYLSGMGMMTISKALNAEGIVCPTVYKNINGSNYTNSNRLNETVYWTETTIKNILKNETYTGVLVQGKTVRRLNRKPKKLPPSQWIRIPDMHEAIISKETFEKAQMLLKRNSRSMKVDAPSSLFAGVLKCKECGRALCKTEYDNVVTYKCSTYKRKGKTLCTPHAIKLETLSDVVKDDLNCMIQQIKDLDAMVKKHELPAKKNFANQKEKLEREIANTKRKKTSSYDDYKEGVISVEDYKTYAKLCDEKMTQLETQLKSILDAEQENQILPKSRWIDKLLQTKKIEVLDKEMVLDMIDTIWVCENHTVEIVYRFSGELDYLFKKQL